MKLTLCYVAAYRLQPYVFERVINGVPVSLPMPQYSILYKVRSQQDTILAAANMEVHSDARSASVSVEGIMRDICEKHPPQLVNGRRTLKLCAGGEPRYPLLIRA